jgi:hypothetical protein
MNSIGFLLTKSRGGYFTPKLYYLNLYEHIKCLFVLKEIFEERMEGFRMSNVNMYNFYLLNTVTICLRNLLNLPYLEDFRLK